jgi:hypothetical protein
MKQLPASHWEKMGLVVGGGATNYARNTERNTRETAQALKTIAGFIAHGGQFGGHGSGGSFGMNPMTSNP